MHRPRDDGPTWPGCKQLTSRTQGSPRPRPCPRCLQGMTSCGLHVCGRREIHAASWLSLPRQEAQPSNEPWNPGSRAHIGPSARPRTQGAHGPLVERHRGVLQRARRLPFRVRHGRHFRGAALPQGGAPGRRSPRGCRRSVGSALHIPKLPLNRSSAHQRGKQACAFSCRPS